MNNVVILRFSRAQQICKYPCQMSHSLLEIFRHIYYVTEEPAMYEARFAELQNFAFLKFVEAGTQTSAESYSCLMGLIYLCPPLALN